MQRSQVFARSSELGVVGSTTFLTGGRPMHEQRPETAALFSCCLAWVLGCSDNLIESLY